MKRKLLSLLLLLSISAGYSQTHHLQLEPTRIHDYLNEVFGEDFSGNQPELVTAFTDLLNNRIEFREEIQQPSEKYPLLSDFPLMNKVNPGIQPFDPQGFDLNTFNPLRYNVGFFAGEIKVVRIDGTPYLMIIHPQ